jgi:hypothetical protein
MVLVSLSLNPNPAPTQTNPTGLRGAINFTLIFFFFLSFFFLDYQKGHRRRQPRKLNFGMQLYFEPTKLNMKKKIGDTPPPPLQMQF